MSNEPQPHDDPSTEGHQPDAHFHQHIRLAIGVFVGLLVLTLVTVGISYYDFGSRTINIVVALIIATFKAGLVAAIFMHLKGEKPTIFRFLYFTFFFFAGLFALTLFALHDKIKF